MNSLPIYYDDRTTGSGKTHGIIEHIIKNKAKSFIVVSPSIHLCKEYYAKFKSLGCNEPIVTITSEETAWRQTTSSLLKSTIDNAKSKNVRIVITTHETLLRSIEAGNFSFKTWHLIIDECINLYSCHKISLTKLSADWFMSLCDHNTSDYQSMSRLTLKRAYSDAGNDLASSTISDSFLSAHSDLLSRLNAENFDVLAQDSDILKALNVAQRAYATDTAEMHTLCVVSKKALEQFESVTILAALFTMTVLSKVLEIIGFKLERVRFARLDQIEHNNGHRLTVKHYLNHDNSQTFMSKLTNSVSNESIIIDRFKGDIDIQRFIFNANKKARHLYESFINRHVERAGQGVLLTAVAGVNNYSDYDCAFYSMSKNLDESAYSVMKAFGIDPEFANDDRNLLSAYQFVSRTSIRDVNATSDVEFHVIDRRTALFLQKMWPGSKIVKIDAGLDRENSTTVLNDADKRFYERFRESWKKGKRDFKQKQIARYIEIFDTNNFVADEIYTLINS